MITHDSTIAMRALEPMRDHWMLPLYEMGSGQGLWPVFGSLYAAGRLRNDADLRDAGMGCLAAHLSSAAARDVIYLAVGRARPHVTANPDSVVVPGTKDWNRHSFPRRPHLELDGLRVVSSRTGTISASCKSGRHAVRRR